MYRLILLLSISCLSSISFAQKVSISGYVKDASSGESLIGAGVVLLPSGAGVYTNEYGFYSLSAEKGSLHLQVTYLGYNKVDTIITANENLRFNIEMKTAAKQIKGVTITAEKEDANIRNTDMGRVELTMEKIKTLPAIFGEVDVLKTIQLLPGVQSGNEGSAGFYVRGGGPDQNLILLDEATVYNSSHLFGFFSVFNPDAIHNATIFKGGIPASYGGRVSSVLDIQMKEGNNKTYHASGGIGLIASRATIEGPLVKDKSSFMVSGRRTYIDVLAKPFIKNQEFSGTGYYFYDFNAKANYTFSDKDRLFVSGYFGRDIFSFKNDEFNISIPWGNATTTLRWNHLFNSKLFMNTSAIYNAYNFKVTADQNNFAITLYSGIRDYNLKTDFDFYPNALHEVHFGANYIFHRFTPSTFSGKSGDTEFNPKNVSPQFAHEFAVYALDKYTITERLEVNYGLRYSMFGQVGPYKKYIYDFRGIPTDSLMWRSGELVKFYHRLEPRILARFTINKMSSVKASFNINNQYIHLVANNGTTLPTDIWVPSSAKVKPQAGYQYAIGYFRNYFNNKWETSVEVYYKKLLNQIEYKEGYTPSANEELEESFVFGTGDSKGLELYLNKKSGVFTGWISYTLSYTNRKFPDLNNGEKFPYRYDRRHVLSVVGNYRINDRWTIGAVFVYNTGIAYTLPIAKYFFEGSVVTQYGPINSFRLSAYHRMDISATYDGKKRKYVDDSWTFSVYNVYNRLNPFFIYDEITGVFLQDPVINIQAKQVTIFPILPSVTWNFKF
jgi:hypothetical protein